MSDVEAGSGSARREVGDGAVGRFCETDTVQHGDRRAWRRDVLECVRDALGKVLSDVFGRGVQRVEGWCGVEIGVIEGPENVGQGMIEGVEIQEQAVGIQGWAAKRDREVKVVAVDRLEYAADEEGVCGTELTVHGDVEHGRRVGEDGRGRA